LSAANAPPAAPWFPPPATTDCVTAKFPPDCAAAATADKKIDKAAFFMFRSFILSILGVFYRLDNYLFRQVASSFYRMIRNFRKSARIAFWSEF
jgi:hypothetical protein